MRASTPIPVRTSSSTTASLWAGVVTTTVTGASAARHWIPVHLASPSLTAPSPLRTRPPPRTMPTEPGASTLYARAVAGSTQQLAHSTQPVAATGTPGLDPASVARAVTRSLRSAAIPGSLTARFSPAWGAPVARDRPRMVYLTPAALNCPGMRDCCPVRLWLTSSRPSTCSSGGRPETSSAFAFAPALAMPLTCCRVRTCSNPTAGDCGGSWVRCQRAESCKPAYRPGRCPFPDTRPCTSRACCSVASGTSPAWTTAVGAPW